MMADFLLWLAMYLCTPLNTAEIAAPRDMPNNQLMQEYILAKPHNAQACHWRLWREEIAKEMAVRLFTNKDPTK